MIIILFVVLILVVIGTILYFVGIYNGLIRLSKSIDKAWSNIGVLLKQRHDEIPKLISVCEGYMKYEKETLKQITEARAQCMHAKSVEDSGKAEGRLSGLLGGLFAVAENYPDLKSNEHFAELQKRISYSESQIADRREFYNDSVMAFNTMVQKFPTNLLAGALGFKVEKFFKVKESEREAVSVEF